MLSHYTLFFENSYLHSIVQIMSYTADIFTNLSFKGEHNF